MEPVPPSSLVTQRVVIVDPGFAHASGHHAEVNRQLMRQLEQAHLAVECWTDEGLASRDPGLRPLLRGCGYVDPRHWLDLPGSLHLASRLASQMEAAAADGPAVRLWIAHSLLPFQLIGLAKLLQRQPAARVEVSILYAPGERLGGSSEPTAVSPGTEAERSLAIANTRVAWSALGRAVRQAGHSLRLGCASRLQAELHQPLLAAAGLPEAACQPAVVGAGVPFEAALGAAAPQVLLHWGDLKAGKGRQEVFDLIETLLAGRVSTPPWRWLFHFNSRESLDSREAALLKAAIKELEGFRFWHGPVDSAAMQAAFADTAAALLPYSPEGYAERSSGVLWCYGAARLRVQKRATAVGHPSGWLAREASSLGIHWQSPTAAEPTASDWLQSLEQCVQLSDSAPTFSPYGQQVLGSSYGSWILGGYIRRSEGLPLERRSAESRPGGG